jgi:hypothetical protein
MRNEPKIILISQWPHVKNGEYELIKRIKRVASKIAVVNFLGFDVNTKRNLNTPSVNKEFDFAIALHYDTPKLLNITTYLWIANPLEFMYLRDDYATYIVNRILSYDDYLYNGSEYLKGHIKNLIGKEWLNSKLEMYPSVSERDLNPLNQAKNKIEKIFYCGVNWERASDKKGRGQELLSLLDSSDKIDIFGPKELEGHKIWRDFNSYRGEIPFDGRSLTNRMGKYVAALALSSPVHIKSETSSSRVFEATAAGVAVISDPNPHTKKLFGDSLYYFTGSNSQEKVKSILLQLQKIVNNPTETKKRIHKAQNIIASKYTFEKSFYKAATYLNNKKNQRLNFSKSIEVFLFKHDIEVSGKKEQPNLDNLDYVIDSLSYLTNRTEVKITLNIIGKNKPHLEISPQAKKMYLNFIDVDKLSNNDWTHLKLAKKIQLMTRMAKADFVAFVTQNCFPHFDHFYKAIEWHNKNKNGIYYAGSYINNFKNTDQVLSNSVNIENKSVVNYEFNQNSIATTQIGSFVFNKTTKSFLISEKLAFFNLLYPISLIFLATEANINFFRSRFISIKYSDFYFVNYVSLFNRKINEGFWSQHYDLLSNHNHELNAFYDLIKDSKEGLAIYKLISGRVLQTTHLSSAEKKLLTLAVRVIKPFYNLYKKIR